MILKDFIDINNKEIDTDKIYFDTYYGIAQIHIIKTDGIWYACPDGLDEEKLEDTVQNLEQNDTRWIDIE